MVCVMVLCYAKLLGRPNAVCCVGGRISSIFPDPVLQIGRIC